MSTYTVQSVSESPAGISVSVSVPPDGNKEAETAEFLISREQWAWGRLSPGDAVSEEEYGRMEHAAVFSRALARTREILSYSGISRHALIGRLRHFGFEDDVCEETADYAVAHGLVREKAQTEHAVDTYLHRKYWGRKRIVAELTARGYAPEVIRDAVAAVPEEEFMRTLASILRRKYDTLPDDPQEKQKMILSLLRLGYSAGEIKQAIEDFGG